MVVEGVLEKMSGRKVISSDGTATYTVRKLGGLYKTKKESVYPARGMDELRVHRHRRSEHQERRPDARSTTRRCKK